MVVLLRSLFLLVSLAALPLFFAMAMAVMVCSALFSLW